MNELEFAFVGDWHGDSRWGVQIINHLAKQGIKRIYHLGDFGVWPNGKPFIMDITSALRKHDMEMFVTLGNHEDYVQVAKMPVDARGLKHFSHPSYSNLHFFQRGHVWEDSGYKFASLGGAASADRLCRQENKSWWREEVFTQEDCDTLVSNVSAMGGVDILLTHEAPAGVTLRGFNPLPDWFTEQVQKECWDQRTLLRDSVLDQVTPRYNVHGHWHYGNYATIDGVSHSGEDYTCDVIGLSNEGSSDNFWIPTREDLVINV